jgi:hypothetical protein
MVNAIVRLQAANDSDITIEEDTPRAVHGTASSEPWISITGVQEDSRGILVIQFIFDPGVSKTVFATCYLGRYGASILPHLNKYSLTLSKGESVESIDFQSACIDDSSGIAAERLYDVSFPRVWGRVRADPVCIVIDPLSFSKGFRNKDRFSYPISMKFRFSFMSLDAKHQDIYQDQFESANIEVDRTPDRGLVAHFVKGGRNRPDR